MSKFVAPRIALLAIAAAFFASACATESTNSGITSPSVKGPASDVIVADGRPAAGNVEVCIGPTVPGTYTVTATGTPPAAGDETFNSPANISAGGCAIVYTRTVPETPESDTQIPITVRVTSVPTGALVTSSLCVKDFGTVDPVECNEPVDGTPGVIDAIVYANAFHGTVVNFAFNAGIPMFVIGDVEPHSVGTNVNFWGSQWWKNNIMSGPVSNGIAGSFKGYASEAGTCGQSWSSRVGNSPPPPSSIGSQIAIIVTSTITKNGPNISGNILQILIVDVDQGYAGNPGHWGTGTVVSIRCPLGT